MTREKLILAAGSLAYVGYVPVASGTVTVLVFGIPLFYAMQHIPLWISAVGTILFTLVSVWLSTEGDIILEEKDSSKMVVDEIVGYAIAVIGLPWTWQIVVTSFLLERIIDIVKIPPANIIENRVPRGWGVVLDDVVAGIYTAIIMRLLIHWRPEWMGV